MRILRKAGSVVVVVVVAVFLLGSCLKTEDPIDNEDQRIESFLGNNPDLVFTRTQSGLYYHVDVAGTGDVIKLHDTAMVFYTLQTLEGITYDSNVGRDTLEFPISENAGMIPGFVEGVSLMKTNGVSLLIVPSSLAYGATGSGPIPGYTPLLFEVKLARIKPGPGK